MSLFGGGQLTTVSLEMLELGLQSHNMTGDVCSYNCNYSAVSFNWTDKYLIQKAAPPLLTSLLVDSLALDVWLTAALHFDVRIRLCRI